MITNGVTVENGFGVSTRDARKQPLLPRRGLYASENGSRGRQNGTVETSRRGRL